MQARRGGLHRAFACRGAAPDPIRSPRVALFDPSEKHRLIETYGLHCYKETAEGLRFEIGFTKQDYILTWLIGFGGKVKVLEPEYIVEHLKTIAQNILSRYN